MESYVVHTANPTISTREIEEVKESTIRNAMLLDHCASGDESTYLAWVEGLKGLLAFESFLWLFFRTFLPACVYGGLFEQEPAWETILRKVLSPLFWDGNLQWSFLLVLSGRVVALRFLKYGTPEAMATSIFKRPFRFLLPVVLAMSIAALINYLGGFDQLVDFQILTKQGLTTVPFRYSSVLAWLNSMFNLFWFQEALQAGVLAHPAGQLWMVSYTFLQSYTIYMTMLLLPYMTREWRVKLLILFIIAAWWVNSLAWYSVTGLVIADNVATLARWGTASWKVDINKTSLKFSIPYWIIPSFLAGLGVFLKYFYAAVRPDLFTNELNAHTSTYLVGGTLEGHVDYSRPTMRLDNYFVVVGVLVLIEMTPWMQKLLSIRPLQYFGHLSFSSYLLQGCLLYTVGVKLYIKTVGDWEWNTMSAAVVILVVNGLLTWVVSDLYARFIDFQGRRLSSKIYKWYST
ncbi:protein of unknown function [Taphrina deformans PYCC 5710]|uniref:Uncharacterized protein n=1 Tax=Taphrina deformans (strain PYCC 5710 / ATCC 11124 / CBS 356.35 / IMI 108563 / JCM 9778 / NBRC 8474) TaxID=1097556 RepID=R4XG26_TAPDE|nr:protein of unknown function [Taphrina deformans PYCC 5710]|eukprot:CCG84675.1 protein of unknown function [Taphrina deformans PYCC 5710]